MEVSFFSQLTVILAISLVASTLLWRLGQPSILAYIFVGILLGPSASGVVPAPQDFLFISEFGVVFLLFTLGLGFSLDHLIQLKRAVFLIGGAQVLLCTAVFFLPIYWWGASVEASFVLAGALAFSSTAIVTKLLSDRNELGYDYARMSIGILLFQDLAALIFLIVIPTLSGDSQHVSTALAMALGKGAVLFVVLIAIGKWVLPAVYIEVAKTRSDEIFVLTTLVIVLLSSWVTHYFHMSMALGGFIIGMMLGGGKFRHQIEADIRPFKDILLGIFFVAVGLQINLSIFFEYWHRILLSAAALLIFKALVVGIVGFVLGEKKKTTLRTSLVVAQGGEFGFALISLATLSGILTPDVSSFMLLVVVVSMLVTPLMITNVRRISDWFIKSSDSIETENLGPEACPHSSANHVIIGGFGRIGQTVAHFLEHNNVPYVAMDTDVNLVIEQRRHGNQNVMYGSCNNLDVLKATGIANARLVVLSFRFLDEAVKTIERIRMEYPDLPIIVRAHHESAFEELIIAGANHVVPEMLEASFMVATQTLSLLGLDEQVIVDQVKQERLKRYSVEAVSGKAALDPHV